MRKQLTHRLIPAVTACLLSVCGTGEPVRLGEAGDYYREEMRTLIRTLSQEARQTDPGFIIIVQNGHELLTDDTRATGAPDTAFLNAVSGFCNEELFYGMYNDDEATPSADAECTRNLLDSAESWHKEVLSLDYCWTETRVGSAYALADSSGYVSFAAPERALDRIPDYPPEPYNMHNGNITGLDDVRNYLYIRDLSRYPSRTNWLTTLAATSYDCLIIDLFDYHGTPLTTANLAALRQKNDGGQRLLIAYLNIGRIEKDRYYWEGTWTEGDPHWIMEEENDTTDVYYVKYWEQYWHDILYRNAVSYLQQIMTAGFDGVCLDNADAFDYFE